MQAQEIQIQRLESIEDRQQVRVADALQVGSIAKFKQMSLFMSSDGDASWTLQAQREFYGKLKNENPSPVNKVESKLVFEERAHAVAYLKEKLKCVERQYSNRN